MACTFKRTIRHAIIGDGIGPVSANELLVVQTERWELWRRMITDAHVSKPQRDIAHCLLCGSPVFIRSQSNKGKKQPLFAHYAGADANCPWFTGDTNRPDDVKAAQYKGKQESQAHRLLCNLVAELAAADPRSNRVIVDKYLPPTANSFGRYPDVLVQWEGFPDLAIEIQLSRTLQTEISQRCSHYEREGMPLIWILHGVDLDVEEIRQTFRDVLSRHRMNAFFLDTKAVAASKAERTLILSCRLAQEGGGFGPTQLVRLDALRFPQIGLPYMEDRLTSFLVKPIYDLRKPWFSALNNLRPHLEGPYIDTKNSQWDDAFVSLAREVPSFQQWTILKPENKSKFANLVAVIFSFITYAQGDFRNYSTKQNNVKAMLNSRFSSESLGCYASLMCEVIKFSSCSELIDGSVGEHLSRAIEGCRNAVCSKEDPEWRAIGALLPEIFDARLRAELTAIGSMPKWTSSAA